MRLSTSMMYDITRSSIQRQQSNNVHIGQQMASGRRVVTPSDDPKAAAHALIVSHSKAVNEHMSSARVNALNHLRTEEGELNTVTDALQAIKPLLVQAGSDALSDSDRESVADELEGVYHQILGAANAQDGNGNYIFSGYKVNNETFQGSGPDVENLEGIKYVSYEGDANERELRVGASRTMHVNDQGEKIFSNWNKSAKYVIKEGTQANNGTAEFSSIEVKSTKSDDGFGDNYTISFSEDANGNLQYTTDGGSTVHPYVAGEAIELGDNGNTALTVSFKGTPKDGDSFELSNQPSGPQDNLINNIADVLSKLRGGTTTPEDKASLHNALNTAHRQTDNYLDNVLAVRSSLGARLNELDVLNDVGDNRNMNYEETLSELRDLDYTTAISEFTLAKIALEVSMRTYQEIDQLSLFNMT